MSAFKVPVDVIEAEARRTTHDVTELARSMAEETARVARQLRGMTPRGERQPCFVCGKYRPITHLHHVIPVDDLARLVVKRQLYGVNLYMPTVWLCPNHHALWHKLEKDKTSEEVWECLTPEELGRYDQLRQMVSTDEIVGMLERARTREGNNGIS